MLLSQAHALPSLPEQDSPSSSHAPTTSPRPIHFVTPPASPAARTGPPRSLSFAFSSPGSPALSRQLRRHDTIQGHCEEGEMSFSPDGMRGALEYTTTTPPRDKKGKRRATRFLDDHIDVLHESPKEEVLGFDFNTGQGTEAKKEGQLTGSPNRAESSKQKTFTQHTTSNHHSKWLRLRSLLPQIVDKGPLSTVPEQEAVHSTSINITDELIGGGLSALMLGLWFQRDEKGRRRIPILLHRLRIRVSDSVNPMHIRKSVFRIECEYANGAARWVIYRELRDFLGLHLHYKLTNVYNRVVDLPEFPRSRILYWKFAKKEDTPDSRAEFARNQRESLEEYLVCLLRDVMFLPSANYLANFLELSTLFISLAQTGGIQAKASFLKIKPVGSSGGGFGRKSVSRWSRGEYRWCAIRDSYLVVVDEPGEDSIWDVFLLDPHFEIQQPKRYYRQGLNLLHRDFNITSGHATGVTSQDKNKPLFQSLRLQLSNYFSHSRRPSNQSDPFQEVLGTSASLAEIQSALPTPMLDPSTNMNPLVKQEEHSVGNDRSDKNKGKGSAADVSKHTFYIVNSQMKLRLRARSERQMLQWITALQKVASHCQYTHGHRYGSFAPVRSNVAAQWLVDGRDYFWNLSQAILLAKESIYIHDWWLSPELQMRRPNKDRYHLDNLLQRKAKEGVKIYVILYQEVSNRTTPTDSNYAKQTLQSLHPYNIMVQRSPSHLQTGTFYWAHHEKLCVIDETIAFMGGIDLCFGRWDSPQHVLTDDGQIPEQIWLGKDYSNPRSRDFHDLHKPLEDMHDRSKTPRMPWHDVGLQIVGQPARDLARHFIQRWNWLLRIKNHSRRLPCLLPPPEFRDSELAQTGLTGTCKLQICRSAGQWSLGTLGHVEHSIQNAYVEAIQNSEHFVYIENQFFITSTVINETKVENGIGDALFNRIMRANRDNTPWKCCIVIPLLPGFTFPVDHIDASAVRIILDCQNRSLYRGACSIFSRLRKEGIDPDRFISVCSLRNWGKTRDNPLVTEQVYIHAKVCIVDDRLAIIGSANINERSQRGERDSELAAIITDTDLVDGMMAGKPFKVGQFAHSLRLRLMREHLGIDVDASSEDVSTSSEQPKDDKKPCDPDVGQENRGNGTATHVGDEPENKAASTINEARDGNDQEQASLKKSVLLRLMRPKRNTPSQTCNNLSNDERKDFTEKRREVTSLTGSTMVPSPQSAFYEDGENGGGSKSDSITDEERQHNDPRSTTHINKILLEEPTDAPGDDSTMEGSTLRARSPTRQDLHKSRSRIWAVPTQRPQIDPHIFEDPVADAFWKDVWVASAIHNTGIYRKVFHAIPDDTVTTWKQYKEFASHHGRMNRMGKDGLSSERTSRAPSVVDLTSPSTIRHEPMSAEKNGMKKSGELLDIPQGSPTQITPPLVAEKPRKPMKGLEPFDEAELAEMEVLLGDLNGHLVVYPSRFLEGEVMSNNFLFPADRLLPLPIYN